MTFKNSVRPILAAATISLLCAAGPVMSATVQPVPDLLALPASPDVRATTSVQLAVARAGNRLVSVGARGIVLISDDDGKSWRQARAVPASVALTDVVFTNDQLGWAVGHSGVVLHTRDGGDSWSVQLDGRQAAERVLEEAQTAEASGLPGAERLVRDARRMVEDGPDKPFLGAAFVDERRGFVVGAYGLALMTEDGGGSWRSIMARVPNKRGNHLYQVRVRDQRVLLVGEQGVIFVSEDGGERFEALDVPYEGTFFGLLALDEQTLLAHGLRGNMWRTEDAGKDWVRIDNDQDVTVTAGSVLADGRVLLGDESGRLLLSADHGSSFVALSAHAPGSITGLAQAADGSVIISSVRGPARIEPLQPAAEIKQ